MNIKFNINGDQLKIQYIRQIKSNPDKASGIFDAPFTYEQLRYSGIFDSVIIMQSGWIDHTRIRICIVYIYALISLLAYF